MVEVKAYSRKLNEDGNVNYQYTGKKLVSQQFNVPITFIARFTVYTNKYKDQKHPNDFYNVASNVEVSNLDYDLKLNTEEIEKEIEQQVMAKFKKEINDSVTRIGGYVLIGIPNRIAMKKYYDLP